MSRCRAGMFMIGSKHAPLTPFSRWRRWYGYEVVPMPKGQTILAAALRQRLLS